MSAREAAVRALSECRRGTHAHVALGNALAAKALPERDKALVTQLFYGVMQNKMLCDFYISHFASLGLNKIEPRVLDILRLSVYQIVFMSGIPHSAAVNEGVSLVGKNANLRAAGFANAVLRKISLAADTNGLPDITVSDAGNTVYNAVNDKTCNAANTETNTAASDGSTAGTSTAGTSAAGISHHLSVKYSHPEWFVKEAYGLLGSWETTEAFLIANNNPATPVTVQVNTLLTDTDAVLVMLEAEGVTAEPHSWLDNCILLRGAGNIQRLDAYRKGFIYVQDAAARLAVMAAAPEPGHLVIDGCAAPGGKSFTAAIMMKNTGRIISYDINAAKLRLIDEGAKRVGISIISSRQRDAADYKDDGYDGQADVVFADVPCSGFGVIRKKPDVRYKTEESIRGLPEIQKAILTGLARFVKPGGLLLYSTCTIRRCENEDVTDWFLRDNPRFRPAGFTLPAPGEFPGGAVTLWPHIHGTDGFYICKMEKTHD